MSDIEAIERMRAAIDDAPTAEDKEAIKMNELTEEQQHLVDARIACDEAGYPLSEALYSTVEEYEEATGQVWVPIKERQSKGMPPMTHTETQAMCERLMHDLTHILPPTQDTWRGLLTDAAALLTRQQEEIELRDAICTEVESVRSLMEAYDRVHEELDRGVPFEKVDHGWIEPAPSYPYWQGYMQQRIMNAMRSALRKGSTYRVALQVKSETPDTHISNREGDGE